MVVTVDLIRLKHPALSDAFPDDPVIEAYLIDARTFISPLTFKISYDLALEYLVVHLLTLERSVQAQQALGTAGPPTSIGNQSQNQAFTGAAGEISKDDLESTTYGRLFIRAQALNIVPGVVV